MSDISNYHKDKKSCNIKEDKEHSNYHSFVLFVIISSVQSMERMTFFVCQLLPMILSIET